MSRGERIVDLKLHRPELTIEEIADRMECSTGLVRYHLKRGNVSAREPEFDLRTVREYQKIPPGKRNAWLNRRELTAAHRSKLEILADKIDRVAEGVFSKGYINIDSIIELYCMGITAEDTRIAKKTMKILDMQLKKDILVIHNKRKIKLSVEQQVGLLKNTLDWVRKNDTWIKQNWGPVRKERARSAGLRKS